MIAVSTQGLVEFGMRRTLIVVGLMLAVLLEIADTTIVNVALPTIQGNIGADFDQASWVITGYLISVIITLPLVPWFEAILGRRRYIVLAILGFTAASIGCGLSRSVEMLVAFRIVQGLFGGGIMTSARGILKDTFPPEQIGRSQGLLAIGAVVGPSIGPTLGGLMTDDFSWRWCFFINVLPGILSALVLFLVLRDPPKQRVSSDGVGLALLITALAPLQYVLQEGERSDWFGDPTIIACTVLALLSGIAFVIWELRYAKWPIVDLRILARAPVIIGTMLSFAVGFTLFVGIVISPQFSQGVLGFTATLSGQLVLVRAAAIMVFISVAVISLVRLGIQARWLLMAGFGLVAYAGVLMAFATTSVSEFWTMGPALALGGFGFGLIFVPLSAAVLATVTGADTSKASSMLSLAQQLGASSATALLVTILDHRAAFHTASLSASITLDRVPLQSFLSAPGSLATLASIVEREAASMAFAEASLLGAAVAFIAVLLAFTFDPGRPVKNT